MKKIELSPEDKALLVKDLCARLPYAVTVEHKSGFRSTLHDVVVYHTYAEDDSVKDYICTTNFFGEDDYVYIEYFKPCLFPMSSMNDEHHLEIEILTNGQIAIDKYSLWDLSGCSELSLSQILEVFDWLNKNHFDYRGLIDKGLAIDATNKDIY